VWFPGLRPVTRNVLLEVAMLPREPVPTRLSVLSIEAATSPLPPDDDDAKLMDPTSLGNTSIRALTVTSTFPDAGTATVTAGPGVARSTKAMEVVDWAVLIVAEAAPLVPAGPVGPVGPVGPGMP
jgi:hypothetical protein